MTKDDRTGSGIETTVDKATMENKIPVARKFNYHM